MRKLIRRIARDTSANILAIGGFGAFALVGGGGLAVDAVFWYLWKRELQQAVDSGALAGSHALYAGGDVEGAALLDLNRNTGAGSTLESTSAPPTSGDWAGDASAVEVIASTSRRLPFTSLFLDAPPTIRARAVAAFVSQGEHCIISLATTGVGVNVAGTADVLLGCGVGANSTGSQAIYLEGSSMLAASPLSAVGGIRHGTGNFPAGTDLNPYGLPLPDPLAARNLAVPSSPAGCTANALVVSPNTVTTLSPGRYCNGLSLKGTVTLNPGVYIIDRGTFEVTSQATVQGEGVTIILTGSSTGNIATAQIAGGADISLSAPTIDDDPQWANILLFQDPRGTATRSEIAGNTQFNLEGVVYLPGSTVRFAGSSGQHSECLLMVANRVMLAGVSSFDNDCPADYASLDLSGRRMRIVE